MIFGILIIFTGSIVCWTLYQCMADLERQYVRPLTMDDSAAWGIYRITASAEVAKRKHTRERDRQLWAVKLAWLERGKQMGIWDDVA